MIASSKRIELRKVLPSGTIVINRPEQKNALTRGMIAAIQEAIEDFQNEKSVRGIILTGAGDTFCAGTDLKELEETLEQPDAIEVWHEDANRILSLIETLLRCPKPIVAALNGDAIGLGGALALAADLRVSHELVRFWFPEPLRGLSNNLGAALMSFRMGVGPATCAMLASEPIPVHQLRPWGLIHDIVPADVVWARAQELVKQIESTAPQAQQLTKQFIYETLGESLWTQLSIATANLATARTTEAALEGIRAFIEKRSPRF